MDPISLLNTLNENRRYGEIQQNALAQQQAREASTKNQYLPESLEQSQQLNSLNIQKQKAESPYWAEQARANALAKEAYAQFMGPQFLAKLAGNEGFYSGLPEANKKLLQNTLVGSTGAAIGQQAAMAPQNNLTNIGSSNLQTYQPQNIKSQVPQASSIPASPTTGEIAGSYLGQREQGKELGKLSAQDIQALGEEEKSYYDQKSDIDELKNIMGSRGFVKLKSLPQFGSLAIDALSKLNVGDPEAQEALGRLQTVTGGMVKDLAKQFGGSRSTNMDIQWASKVKPDASDPVPVMLGKIDALGKLADLKYQRTQVARNLMEKSHLSKGEAFEEANKILDFKNRTSEIQSNLKNLTKNTSSNKQFNDEDIKFTAKKYGITEDEVRKRLESK